ncbi:MAG TPA: serine/threonine-protein kinase [Nocardioides sp.]|nr:serine/threonine-protein kinase [Nocardioides sp.]
MTITRVADRYVLDREVGRGACGAVWAASDEVLGRPVAMKRLGPPPGSVDTESARAEREARLAAQVAHPHVISVYDLVQEDDHHWLVMEYVDGCPFSTVIASRGPLPPDEVAHLMAPVADALAFAHDLGIVHRDVKPSNILVRRDGEAKLTDFGIARALQDPTVTQTGVVTGSPAYLAPEVASGQAATPASDVWSFGATLFHALAGEPPYHRADADNAVLAVLYRIATEEPPRLPSAGRLGRLLELTMAVDPANRLTMAEVHTFLQEEQGVASAPDRTMVLPTVAPGPAAAELATMAWSPQAAEVTRAARPAAPVIAAHGPRRRRTSVVVAAVAGLAAVMALVTFLVTSGGDQSRQPSARAVDPTAPPTVAQASDHGSGKVTAEDLEAFAENYVQTAQRDPAAGFRMLTVGYQRRSPAYDGFWGQMRAPRILDISADPKAMTVTYDYRYQLRGGGSRTEKVTLELVRQGGRLLIANAH